MTPSPRFLIDSSTYLMNNNGDKAMLSTLVQRLRKQYPDAQIRIMTNDPAGIKALDPQVEPLIVGDRRSWQYTYAISVSGSEDQTLALAALQLDTLLSRTLPDQYQALLAEVDKSAATARQGWQHALDQSDAVFLMGGGYFTDAFAEHAAQLMHTLAEGIRRNVPTFIVGCGFEPVSNSLLLQTASDTLPRVTAITCRESLTSPGVLRSLNVAPEQFTVTGDDAVELAYAARPAALGARIGIGLRDHSYNAIDEHQYQVLRHIINDFATEKRAALQPAPISNYLPSDLEAIQRILPNGSIQSGVLNTPALLLPEIANCRIMITGSYHAAVFALSMGIPTICLSRSSHYQHKMFGLLSMFDAHPEERLIALDNANLTEKLGAALQDTWTNAESERSGLLVKAEAQIKLGIDAYVKIFDSIEMARAKPSVQPPNAIPAAEYDIILTVLRGLGQHIKQLQLQREYLQFHADERLKIIETRQASPNIPHAIIKQLSWFKRCLSQFR